MIYFITSNDGKVDWANNISKQYGVKLIKKPYDFIEERDINPLDVALVKLKQIKDVDKPFILTDFGFDIEALNHFPGGVINPILNTIGVEGILKLMDDKNNRSAKFISIIIYKAPNEKEKIFIGEYPGKISKEIFDGNLHGWSDLLKIFIPEGYDKAPTLMNDREWEGYQTKFESAGPFVKFLEWYVDENEG